MIYVVIVMALIPVVYSYIAYRRIEGFAPDPVWLDVTPTGIIYASPGNDSATVSVNILETAAPSATNYAAVIVQAEDYYGKVNVFKEVDINYRVLD